MDSKFFALTSSSVGCWVDHSTKKQSLSQRDTWDTLPLRLVWWLCSILRLILNKQTSSWGYFEESYWKFSGLLFIRAVMHVLAFQPDFNSDTHVREPNPSRRAWKTGLLFNSRLIGYKLFVHSKKTTSLVQDVSPFIMFSSTVQVPPVPLKLGWTTSHLVQCLDLCIKSRSGRLQLLSLPKVARLFCETAVLLLFFMTEYNHQNIFVYMQHRWTDLTLLTMRRGIKWMIWQRFVWLNEFSLDSCS